MSGWITRGFWLVALLLIWLPTQAGAATIYYDIQMGSQGGFAYSYIHSADNEMESTGLYPSGSLLFEVTSLLKGDLSGNTLTIISSSLTAEGLPAGPSGTHTLQLTGGSLDNSSGYAGGTIDYVITLADTSVYDSGAFYFEPLDLTGPANSFSGTAIYLWGQNWDKDVETRAEFVARGGTPLGIDLGGVLIPEPASIFLVGGGLLGLVLLKRRRA